ncbi:MAG: peptidoglycan-binding protein [Proteobacteria bacterium]|nr:peptidoglycan-binding protein [Pseudomonadota bacterium]
MSSSVKRMQGLAALCLAATIATAVTPAAAVEPKAGEDISDKTVYLAPGARLRYGEGLLTRVYARTNEAALELKGNGKCSNVACPVMHNKVAVFARRARLDTVKPSGPVVSDRTLRRGDDGEDVRAFQEILNRKGAKLTVDGRFGSSMEEAVREFQRKNGLFEDGEIGSKTREKLRA